MKTATQVRVLFVDDDTFAARAFAALLSDVGGIEVTSVTGDASAVMDACLVHEPDAVLVDLSVGPRGTDGIQFATMLRASHPDLTVITCTGSESSLDAARAWSAGIRTYVTKRQLLQYAERIPMLIRGALEGHTFYHVDPRSDSKPPSLLSDREMEVLRRKLDGQTHRQIATNLYVSVRTVDSHLANIRGKLGARTIQEALRYVVDHGLLVAHPAGPEPNGS